MKAIIKVSTLNTPQHVNFVQTHQQELRVLTAHGGLRRAMQQKKNRGRRGGNGEIREMHVTPHLPIKPLLCRPLKPQSGISANYPDSLHMNF